MEMSLFIIFDPGVTDFVRCLCNNKMKRALKYRRVRDCSDSMIRNALCGMTKQKLV